MFIVREVPFMPGDSFAFSLHYSPLPSPYVDFRPLGKSPDPGGLTRGNVQANTHVLLRAGYFAVR